MITVREQLEIVKGLMGYRYGDAEVDARVTDAIANQMRAWGVTDIRDFGRANDSLAVDCMQWGAYTGILSGFHFVNTRTNASLTPVHWNSFTGTGLYEDVRFGPTGGVFCGFYKNSEDDYSYYWDSRFDNYLGDAGNVGDNLIQIFAHFLPDGIPYFSARLFNQRGMSFGQALKELATIVFAAVTFVVPGVNAAVAGSIFGSFATAYPALTAAASQVMMQTALSGGDVEAAVKNVALSYVGQSAGTVVQGVSDSQALGQLAAAATTAAASGGDVEAAVARAALRMVPAAVSGAVDYFQSDSLPDAEIYDPGVPATAPVFETGENDMSIFDIPTSAPSMDWDPLYQASIAAPDLEEMASWAPAVTDIGIAFDNGSVPLNAPTFEPIGYSLDDLFTAATGEAPIATPVSADGSGGALPAAIAAAPAGEALDTPASSFFSEVTWDDTVDNLTDLAIAAIRVHQAYQVANRPPVQPAVQTTRAGAAQTARPDGTLATVEQTTGRTVVTRPPVGVPYELPGGGAVINNGNGTYTTVSATGETVTRSYAVDVPLSGIARVQPETWIDGVPNWAIIGASVIGLFIATRR